MFAKPLQQGQASLTDGTVISDTNRLVSEQIMPARGVDGHRVALEVGAMSTTATPATLSQRGFRNATAHC